MKKIFYLSLLVLLLSACIKEEFDLTKVGIQADASPSLAVPLVYGNISLEQILPDTEGSDVYLFVDNQNLLHLKYGMLLDSFTLSDIITTVPDQDTAVVFKSGTFGNFDFSTNEFNAEIPITSNRTLYYTFKPDENEMFLDSMVMKSGRLKIDIQADFKFTGDYLLEFPFVISPQGEPLKLKYSVVDGSSITSKYVDVTNYHIGLVDDNTGEPNKLKVNYGLDIERSTVNIGDGAKIVCTLTTDDLIIDAAYGFLGFQSVDLDNQSIDFDFSNQLLTGDLYLAEPSIKLNLVNGFGFPMRTTLSSDMKAIAQDGTEIPFTVTPPNNPKNIAFPSFPAQVGQTVSDALVIDNTTSNIADILASKPTKITLGGKIEVNPDNNKTLYNFVTPNSYLKVSLDLDLPINFELRNLIYSDTLSVDLSDIIGNMEDVTNLELDVNFLNGLPLQLGTQLYFYNQKSESNTEMASLPTDSLMQNNTGFVIASASTLNGTVTTPTQTFQAISYKGEKLQKIKDTKYILLKVYLNTNQHGIGTNHNPVKVLSTDSFTFRIGAKAEASLKLNK